MEKNSDNTGIWMRLLYMLLFVLIYSVAEFLLAVVVLIQIGFVLFTGERNQKLLELGAGLGLFIYETLRFLTFNSEKKPFPFSDWPAAKVD
jgi:hypothetical protein